MVEKSVLNYAQNINSMWVIVVISIEKGFSFYIIRLVVK